MILPASFRPLLVLVFLSPALTSLLPDATGEETTPGKKYALIVGVRDYDSVKLDPLKFTENDAEELATLLKDSGNFSVRVLTTSRGKRKQSDAPTTANILVAVKDLLAKKTRHDTVLVALSGHGIQGKVHEKDESFFCPTNAQLNDYETLISMGKLFSTLDSCGAGVKLLLVDACRNEPASGRNVDVDSLPRLPRGTAALFSCKSGERAFETAQLGKGHGVFFHHVLLGLGGKAKNARGEVTWARLAEYVTDAVSDEVPTLIGGGAKQTPELKVNLTGKSPILLHQSEAEFLFRLAQQHYYGQGKPINYVEAAAHYRQAHEKGHPLAAGFLGVLYSYGMGVQKDAEKGRNLCQAVFARVKEAAATDSARAQTLLGLMYDDGLGVEKNPKEAVRWYRLAAEQNDATAQNNLGAMYKNGQGVNKDETEAVRWYRKAADQGLAVAQYNLGWMVENGRGGEKKDEREAFRWYRLAAEQGFARAQDNLGWMYESGQAVAKDETEAVRWYRKAAQQDLATAKSNLGLMYADGRGVKKDAREAIRWFRQAANQGLAVAQTNLGAMYETGQGVKKNEKEAVRWYRQAAQQDLATAQSNLGRMYAAGRGVPRNLSEARKWFQKAAAQGDQDAKSQLARLSK